MDQQMHQKITPPPDIGITYHDSAPWVETPHVPPDFNTTIMAIWEELWHTIPQSGKVSVTVTDLLQRYKER